MTRKKTYSRRSYVIKQSERREFLKGMSLVAASAGAASALPKTGITQTGAQAPATPAPPATASPKSGESKLFATVETSSGKVQGMITAGIKEFKGIPYGASTAGKKPLHAAEKANTVDWCP